MDDLLTSTVATFETLRFDRRLGELSRRDESGAWSPVAIGSRAAAILGALLRQPGVIVSKAALMDEVWTSTTVEVNNLTVQIAALRRAIDEGRTGDSLIQTVAGRGYRFVGSIDLPEPAWSISPGSSIEPEPISRTLPRRRWARATVAAAIAGVLLLGLLRHSDAFNSPAPPRVSLIVLPFQNLGGDRSEDYLANTVTDDLVTRMSLHEPSTIRPVPPGEAKAGDLTPADVRRRFNVRYMLGGSVRRLGTVLHVNAQMWSTETGDVLWTDRFDTSMVDPGTGQQQVVRRIGIAARSRMIVLEDARSRRERPNSPDALDLVIGASALELLPPDAGRIGQAKDLYERAVQADPSMDSARMGLMSALLDGDDESPPGRKAVLEQTRQLVGQMRSSGPAWWGSMLTNLHWLSWQLDRCPETIDAGQVLIAAYPDITAAYRWVGDCKARIGLAAEALPFSETAVQRDQGLAWVSHDDRNLQYAYLLLGRTDESITWGTRALLDDPEDTRWERGRIEFRLASTYALAGHLEEAKHHLANALTLIPVATLRQFEEGRQASPAYAAQVGRVIDGLRLAGLRDHADDSADPGVAGDNSFGRRVGRVPTSVPGAKTIDTDALVALLPQEKPVVNDTLGFFAGRSLSGAIGLKFAGEAGDMTGLAQDHLQQIARELTHGNLGMPVVAVGWNSESFGGRNLARRLAALGYSNLYWYRGGREAWEARGLPEADLVATDW